MNGLLSENENGGANNVQRSAVILVACLLLLAGCKTKNATSNKATSKPDQTADPLVFQPQGKGTVKAKIQLPDGKEFSLFQVWGNDIQLKMELESGAPVSLELESGLYVAREQNTGFAVAVPALAISQSELLIDVESPPGAIANWCWIPSGPTLIGDTLGVGREDERPARIEHVDGFWMGKTEVTNGQYAEFLSGQKQVQPNWIDLESRKCLIEKTSTGNYTAKATPADAGKLPVVMVSLQGSLAYCNWLSSKLGHRVRLPTEVEWEKAARGPESFVYSY